MENGPSLLRKREYQILGPPSTPLSAESRIATRGQDRQKRLKVRASILGPSPIANPLLPSHIHADLNQQPFSTPTPEQLARAERNRLAALQKLKSQQRPASSESFRNWRTPNAMELEEEMKQDPFFSRVGSAASPSGLTTPLQARQQPQAANPPQAVASQSSSQPWTSKPVIVEDDEDDQEVIDLSDSDGSGAQFLTTPVTKRPVPSQPVRAVAPASPLSVAVKTSLPNRKIIATEPVPFGKISERAIAEVSAAPVEQQLSPLPPGFETISSRKLRHLLFR